MAYDYIFGNDEVPRPPTGFDPTGASAMNPSATSAMASPARPQAPLQPRPSGVFDRMQGAPQPTQMPAPQLLPQGSVPKPQPPGSLPQMPSMPGGPQGPPKTMEDMMMLDAQAGRKGAV